MDVIPIVWWDIGKRLAIRIFFTFKLLFDCCGEKEGTWIKEAEEKETLYDSMKEMILGCIKQEVVTEGIFRIYAQNIHYSVVEKTQT